MDIFIVVELGPVLDTAVYRVVAGGKEVFPMTTLLLHARPTDTLYHAEDSGEINVYLGLFYLTDEDGNRLTDESANILVAYMQSAAVVLHAPPTDTLYHAEAS